MYKMLILILKKIYILIFDIWLFKVRVDFKVECIVCIIRVILLYKLIIICRVYIFICNMWVVYF